MEIRFGQPGDIPGIIELLRQVGQVHHLGRPDIFRAGAQKYDEGHVAQMLGDPENPIFVATDGDNVLGYGFCFLKKFENDPVIYNHKELYIDDLCVDEACRGRHIGAKLYDHICAYARTLGCRSVTLNVWSCNEKAMGFYEKLGLKPQKVGMEMLLENE